MADPFISEIRLFGLNFAVRGWAFCNGQLLPISQNSALFSLIGTIYGGDGRTTMGLPNLQGRVPMHFGNGPGLTPRRIGEIGGTETHTLNVTELASHTHAATTTLHADQIPGSTTSPAGAFLAETAGTNIFNPTAQAQADLAAGAATTAVQNSGGNQAFNIMQPFQCVSFEIALFGVFPSRS